MTVAKRFAIFALLFNVILLPFCWGSALNMEFNGLNVLLMNVLYWSPPLAAVLLFAGCLIKERRWQSGVCSSGLAIFCLMLITLLGSWNYVHGADYTPYAKLQDMETPEINLMYGTISGQDITSVELEQADAARLMDLLEQVHLQHRHVHFWTVREEYVPEDWGYFQFSIDMERDKIHRWMGAWPPYYIFGNEMAAYGEDEELCQEIADLYWELVAKYAPAEAQLAAE